MNGKTSINNYLAVLGEDPHWLDMMTVGRVEPNGAWTATLDCTLLCGHVLFGTATDSGRRRAEVAACDAALQSNPLPDAADSALRREAQLGDALIKFAAYVVVGENTSDASRWLQAHESNEHLASLVESPAVVDALALGPEGLGRGHKHRSTLVEAAIWRRFGADILSPKVRSALNDLVLLLSGSQDDGAR